MNLIELVVVPFVAGIVGAMTVDVRFWWSFVQEVYYHHPGNHLCHRSGCCR